MRRKQIYMDEALDVALRKVARADGRSAAALIREAVSGYLERRGRPAEDPIRELIGAFDYEPTDAATAHDRYLYGRDP